MRPPHRYCHRCGERVPYAAATCHRCGRERYKANRRRSRVPLRHWVLGLVVMMLIALALFAQNRMLVAERYAGFAARWLPEFASSFAPAETEEGAFYFCVRRVVKEIDPPESIATFPSSEEAETKRVDDNLYRVAAFVDQSIDDGTEVRRPFTCTAAYESSRWKLQELAIDMNHDSRPELARGR